MTAQTRRARCCCGRCSIEVKGEPAINAICHCRDCKKRTGSAFGWSCYFDDAQVTRKTGEFGTYVIDGRMPQKRWFCSHCGTTLYWKSDFLPAQTGVAGGCFADDMVGAPSITVSDDGRCLWLSLPAGWRTSL